MIRMIFGSNKKEGSGTEPPPRNLETILLYLSFRRVGRGARGLGPHHPPEVFLKNMYYLKAKIKGELAKKGKIMEFQKFSLAVT